MHRILNPLAALLMLAAPCLGAAEFADLERYYTEVDSLSGRFVQETRDEDGRLIERSEGTLAIQRPNRFHWHYETPFEQDIVADGIDLWIHDQDLEQVTVRPLEEVLGTGPALMLSGRLEDLESQFHIHQDDDWIRLEPREEGWEVSLVRLRMNGSVPRKVVVIDGMGQVNSLELSDLEMNPRLDPNRFDFRPPAGVDVIGERSRR